MSRLRLHPEDHLVARIGWVLGANDAIGAQAGSANVLRATARVMFWGALAMALTAGIGRVFGTVV